MPVPDATGGDPWWMHPTATTSLASVLRGRASDLDQTATDIPRYPVVGQQAVGTAQHLLQTVLGTATGLLATDTTQMADKIDQSVKAWVGTDTSNAHSFGGRP